jgi:hypothetical protein
LFAITLPTNGGEDITELTITYDRLSSETGAVGSPFCSTFINHERLTINKNPRKKEIHDMTTNNARKKLVKLLPILILTLLIGTVSAAVFTMYYGNVTATVKTPDVQLIAGSDSATSPIAYPNATVTVASTYDYATIAFSLFPSATNTPQPATYYTNLTLIKNTGSVTHTITNITLSGLTNMANLGNVTVYLYNGTQTDSPTTATAQGYATLTSGSTGTVTLTGIPVTLPAGDICYIEIVGYAASGIAAGQTVVFTVSITWH